VFCLRKPGLKGAGCDSEAEMKVCRMSRITLLIAFALAAVFLSAPSTAQAATYYIDCSAGVDSNNGTSSSTPWLHHPYMHGFTGSYTHHAGDQFYFKGGVTCPNSYFPLTALAGGSSGNPDYYGTDPGFSWYTGTSSGKVNTVGTLVDLVTGNPFVMGNWNGVSITINGTAYTVANVLNPSRLLLTSSAGAQSAVSYSQNTAYVAPQWDMQNALIGGSMSNNQVADLASHAVSFVTLDGFEIKGFFWNAPCGFGNCTVVNAHNTGSNITLNHLYIHGWSHANCGSSCTGWDINNYILLGPNQPVGANFSQGEYTNILEYSTIACPVGDGNCDGVSMEAVGAWAIVHDTIIHDLSNAEVGVNYQWYNNLMYNCGPSFDPSDHTQCYEGNPTSGDTTPQFIYNNVGYNSSTGSYMIGLYGDDQNGGSQRFTYIFNNVFYSVQSTHAPIETDSIGGNQNVFVYNNTLIGRPGGQACVEDSSQGVGLNTLVIVNNFCITDNTSAPYCITSPCHGANTLTIQNNAVMTTSNASAIGISPSQIPYVGLPPNMICGGKSQCPVGAGANLTSTTPGCATSSANSGSMAALCSGTPYGVTGTQATVMRPTTGAWDAGAFQMMASGTMPNNVNSLMPIPH